MGSVDQPDKEDPTAREPTDADARNVGELPQERDTALSRMERALPADEGVDELDPRHALVPRSAAGSTNDVADWVGDKPPNLDNTDGVPPVIAADS